MHYLPDIHDYFPKRRRGHGTTHPIDRTNRNGVTVRRACRCVNTACSLHRREGGEQHEDPAANVNEWKAERGFHKDTPLEDCQ